MSFSGHAVSYNNARLIDPVRVARTFVMPPFFRRLFDIKHHLLVGPRGSGKTTLLKMLRLSAVAAWPNEDGAWARANLPFIGVFIPSDVGWNARLRSQASLLPDSVSSAYTRAAISLLLKRALVEAFSEKCRAENEESDLELSLAFSPLPVDTHTEVALCGRLAAAWNVEEAAPTFRGLRSALSGQLVLLSKTLDEAIDAGDNAAISALSRRIASPISETVSHSIDLFEQSVDRDGFQWALLFDELEITPEWFQEEALRRFRSTDQRLLFKLAITPCGAAAGNIGGLTQPHRTDDYEEVPLWYSDTRDAMPFCNAFWKKLIESRGLPDVSPRTVLGDSISEDFEPILGARSGRYGPKGLWIRRLAALARRDRSFAEYLTRRGVDVTRPSSISPEKMDSVVRKVAPIAFYREYFTSPAVGANQNSTPRLRSRKTVALYSGAKNVFRVTEGNPRWYLSLVGNLVDLWKSQGRTISRQQQADAISASSDRFLATVAAYPTPTLVSSEESRFPNLTLLKLIEILGSYSFSQIVGKEFHEDPRLSFSVDTEDPRIESLLNVAINSGALVLIARGGDSFFIERPKGRQLRLSYHLAPRFRFPLRVGRPIGLQSVLRLRQATSISRQGDQLEIFADA